MTVQKTGLDGRPLTVDYRLQLIAAVLKSYQRAAISPERTGAGGQLSEEEARERERLADERWRRSERTGFGSQQQAEREQARLLAMGRPEYMFEKNGSRKQGLYERHVRFARWERSRAEEGVEDGTDAGV